MAPEDEHVKPERFGPRSWHDHKVAVTGLARSFGIIKSPKRTKMNKIGDTMDGVRISWLTTRVVEVTQDTIQAIVNALEDRGV